MTMLEEENLEKKIPPPANVSKQLKWSKYNFIIKPYSLYFVREELFVWLHFKVNGHKGRDSTENKYFQRERIAPARQRRWWLQATGHGVRREVFVHRCSVSRNRFPRGFSKWEKVSTCPYNSNTKALFVPIRRPWKSFLIREPGFPAEKMHVRQTDIPGWLLLIWKPVVMLLRVPLF